MFAPEMVIVSEEWNSTHSQFLARTPANCSVNEVLVDFKCIDKDLKESNSSLLQFISVTSISVLWVIYITYFNARVIGFIITKLFNQFYKKNVCIKFGSISFSVISGKIMFRDVQYITSDSFVKIYDGYCIFRWWRPYKFGPWRKKRDLSQGHTRLSVVISGIEYHVFNRSHEYQRLESLFGLDSKIFSNISRAETEQTSKRSDERDTNKSGWWRNLIPVVKFSISYGKVIFGNRLLSSTLVIAFDDASFQYKTTRASNKYDLFMHAMEGSLGSSRFMLVTSSHYDPVVLPQHHRNLVNDYPPRKMSEGFDLMHSNNVHFKYTWDEPGEVNRPFEQTKFFENQQRLNNGDEDDDSPVWELEVQFRKRVSLNYGPWADRQVLQLWKFFYPNDYQDLVVTPEYKDGDRRAAASCKIFVNLLHESDVDLLFLKNDKTNAIHLNLAKGSCIEMFLPMTVLENGYSTQVSGRFLFLHTTSSMLYRPLLDAETLSFNVIAHYPIRWNGNQFWTCAINATKVSASLVFAHKNFISDLMNDWSSRDPQDLQNFVPYQMSFKFDIQAFELLLPANEHNWVDCATKRKENALIGICGDLLKIDFALPFDSFLAPTYTVSFHFQICGAELCLFLPLSNPSRQSLHNLSESMNSWNKDKAQNCVKDNRGHSNINNSASGTSDSKNTKPNAEDATHRIRKEFSWGSINSEWVKCWDAPVMELVISYTWHPIIRTRGESVAETNFTEKEKVNSKFKSGQCPSSKNLKLSKKALAEDSTSMKSNEAMSLLPGTADTLLQQSRLRTTMVTFDPSALDPDDIRVEFSLNTGSKLYLYGSLLHHLIAIKENYLGVDDICTDFADGQKNVQEESKIQLELNNDPQYYRTLQVTVNVSLHEICGFLPVHPNPVFKYCPTVRLKRLSFEMDKNYHQTRLQLLLSKLAIMVEECNTSTSNRPHQKLKMREKGKGWLTLMDLQLRGHAMFSGAGIPLGAATIEYAWLMEVLIGTIVGNLTVTQIQFIGQWAQMFLYLFKNSAHEMVQAFPHRILPTGLTWDYIKQDGTKVHEGDVKFLMIQAKLESVILRVEESDSAIDMVICPILISNGNIQFPGVKEAAVIQVQEFEVKHRIRKSDHAWAEGGDQKQIWVEAGEVKFGVLHTRITVAMPEREIYDMQTKFLQFHDKKTRRLNFLWKECTVDGADVLQNPVLSGVKALKSWGCSFFIPMTSKHPTYFYYINKELSSKSKNDCDGIAFSKSQRFRVIHEISSSSSEEDTDSPSSNRDSDVFDPGMDYGMSLLKEGTCLLSRSSTLSDMSKESRRCRGSLSKIQVPEISLERQKSAGELLSNSEKFNEADEKVRLQLLGNRPSLRRQERIMESNGNISGFIPSPSRRETLVDDVDASLVSLVQRHPHSSADPDQVQTASAQQQVSFAPGPEKICSLKKCASQTDLNRTDDIIRQSIKRTQSSDSNLYRSAESDFKSTSSVSSLAADDFYSAESDMDESKRNSIESDHSSLPTATSSVKPLVEIPPRPGTLTLENEHTAVSLLQVRSPKSPPTISSNSFSHPLPTFPVNCTEDPVIPTSNVKSSHEFSKQSEQQQSLLNCYENYLALSQYEIPRERILEEGVLQESYKDILDEWYDHGGFLLPRFATFRDGIHPSVMVDRQHVESCEKNQHKTVNLNQELSFEEDSSGNSTSVSVHLKESFDVQITPFMLETVVNILDASIPLLSSENPMDIISHLQIECAEDAAVHMSEKVLEPMREEKGSKESRKSPFKVPSQSKVNDTSTSGLERSKHVLERPLPGTKLSIRMDQVRVNILQATLGDDKIFSLHSSKLLPAPCITVLAARLDSLHVSVDLNSRRKNRLLIENFRKLSHSSSSSDRKPFSKENVNYNALSDLQDNKHFLVLLNLKANARYVGTQMRALTCDGSVPHKTSITALSEKVCKAPFEFDPSVSMPDVKDTLDKWKAVSQSRSKPGRYPIASPKLWGWVMLEAGIDRMRLDVIKQFPVHSFAAKILEDLNLSDEPDEDTSADKLVKKSPAEESIHVHFMDQGLKSLSDQSADKSVNGAWTVKDTSLHTTQGELLINSVWINVPSPSFESTLGSSRLLRTWNLLSCVSSSINTWLVPVDRTISAFNRYKDESVKRKCAVVACVLTGAFENLTRGLGLPEKPMEPATHRYDVLTAKARYLRADPNFLICHELQRYLSEEMFRETVLTAVGPLLAEKQSVPPLPALSTLKKGVVALVRQWTSQYAGVITAGTLGNPEKHVNANGSSAVPISVWNDPTRAPETATDLRHLLVEVVNTTNTSEVIPNVETSPRRKSKQLTKSDTFTSLEAVEEGMSGIDTDSQEPEKPGQRPKQPTVKQKTLMNPRLSHMTSTEELVYEQQQSMYSWMSNAVKHNSPSSDAEGNQGVHKHVESQVEIPMEAFAIEQANHEDTQRSTCQVKETDAFAQTTQTQLMSTMQITDYEEVFEIFLRNIGIHSESSNATSTGSFISSECLGSLSLNTTLHSLSIEKQEADQAYSQDAHSRRRKKVVKSRKPQNYYSSMEHGREPRSAEGVSSSTWPNYSMNSMAPNLNTPILFCHNVSIKSSTIETKVESVNRTKFSSKGIYPKVTGAVHNHFTKDKSTLKLGVELSLGSIVQHVDIALVRLIHQITQVSENVKQAYTDIQVNKYTEGSASPDIKVLHRRDNSNISGSSADAVLGIKRLSSEYVSQSIIDQDTPGSDDAISHSSNSSASSEVPHCWQVMYKMVDLYNTVPDQKTEMITKPVSIPSDTMHLESEGLLTASEATSAGSILRRTTFSLARHEPYLSLMLNAKATVKKVQLLAAVGDLSLEAEIVELVSYIDHSKTINSGYKQQASSDFKAVLDGVNVMLLDKAKVHRKKIIAQTSVKQSSLDASTNHERKSQNNICHLHLGLISFDLSQHPASLHDVVTRGSRQLSVHISEFAQTPTVRQSNYFDIADGAIPRAQATPVASSTSVPPMTPMTPSALTTIIDLTQDSSSMTTSTPVTACFFMVSDGIVVMASLLPSLRAQYKTGEISGEGRTGLDATFSFSVPSHALQFSTMSTVHGENSDDCAPTTIDLPQIDIDGEYKQADNGGQSMMYWNDDQFAQLEGGSSNLQLRPGNYLSISVNIGSFEHCLTTDLLNQLVILQEVFVKEINEMVEKVSKGSNLVPLWSETSLRSEESSSAEKPLLYQLKLTLQGIQITAATLSFNAVRLKTGEMRFELSNRVVQNKKTKKKKKGGISMPNYLKLFGKAQVDLTLSLGMLVRNSVYPEAEDEFQQLAYFTTRIGLQNTRQAKDESAQGVKGNISSSTVKSVNVDSTSTNCTDNVDPELLSPPQNASTTTDNSVVLISLKRPIFFIQPTAFDKAILVYLSYKNAYEDWKEQQHTILQAARQVRDVLHPAWSQASSSTSIPTHTQYTSTLFLQLSVNDLGICLPISQDAQLHEMTSQDELSSALVLTIDSTLISAYYSRSLVTKGLLEGFCLRFADDFQTSWDDWKHNTTENMAKSLGGSSSIIMNACVVPKGTYEICSDTTSYQSPSSAPSVAKTTVNVLWKMMGTDIHMDTKIGSYFSKLADTLMVIAGENEPCYMDDLDMQTSGGEEATRSDDNEVRHMVDGKRSRSATTTSNVSSSSISLRIQKERTRKIEHELNEQVKVLNDLKQLGAKRSVIEEEERRMHDLEAALSSNFRRVVRSRLRRSSINTRGNKKVPNTAFKPRHQRTKSATTSKSVIEIPPRSSQSAYSTLPRDLQGAFWMHGGRDTYSATEASFQATMNENFSPESWSHLTNLSDRVLPPSNIKHHEKGSSRDDDTDEDISSDDDREMDFDATECCTEPSEREISPGRRRLNHQDVTELPDGAHRIVTSKSESHLTSQVLSTVPDADLLLQLDVKVNVTEGKIECHPNPQEMETSIKTEYSIPPVYGNTKTKNFIKNSTIFYIPGVSVKAHYNSASQNIMKGTKSFNTKKKCDETDPSSSNLPERNIPKLGSLKYKSNRPEIIEEDEILIPKIELTTPSHLKKREQKFVMPDVDMKAVTSSNAKRACVYVWLSVQSLPEMVISPYLLDFVEEALAEIPSSSTPSHSFSKKHSTTSSHQGSFYDSFDDDDGSDLEKSEKNEEVGNGSVLSSESSLVSLPLDVVVSVNVQPSQVRFNCVPASRVECLFQIPSMDLAFSSVQDDFQSESTGKTSLKTPTGLSFSAILSDFSIYVFHPYGGKHPTSNTFPLDPTGNFTGSPLPGMSDSPFQKSGSGRRDSLSVNLEIVKINLVRKRKGETILVADTSSAGSAGGKIDNVVLHFSGLMDIGTASFKYDMRRLSEILAFPRTWYRHSIAKRLFLGDTNDKTIMSPKPKPKMPRPERKNTKLPQTRARSHTNPVDSSILSFLTVDSPLSPHRSLTPKLSNLHRQEFSPSSTSTRSITGNEDSDDSVCGQTTTSGLAKWHAIVLLGLNMSHLNVEMNMSNVMGNTVWSCDALQSQGRLKFHSNGDKDIILTCGVENSQLMARGGIIGGQIELRKFDADCYMNDPAEGDPLHKLAMRANSLDGRIEYMGGCIMIGQLTNANLQLKDEWRDPKKSIPSTMDKGTVFVHCDLAWRVFQLAISRSTTPDVIKMLSKLEEFFSQQFHSSVRAISTWTQSNARPASPHKMQNPGTSRVDSGEVLQYDHRRHWPPVFQAIAETLVNCELFSSRKHLQNRSFLLGGSACLHGDGLIVVCFHGANFRSHSWVLFNILQPNIVFSTEVQEIKESMSGDETSILAIQSLSVNLGHDIWLLRTMKPTDPMATVSRVTRSRNQNPPAGSAPISEWFTYVTASHNEELKMLRTLNDIGAARGAPTMTSTNRATSSIHRNSESSTETYSHEADIIFALPKVQLDFKTEHMQGPIEPHPEDVDNKPVVECSFVTEFTDHICVTMDVELILFLHDLVSSYLKEKQQALSSRSKLSSIGSSHWNNMGVSFVPEQKQSNSGSIDPIDLRVFVCNTWQLEPTVRLISWAGRRIEPVGVDYILQKLGFQHARTTIPKWFQRGVLDLLDKGLAIIVQKLVVAIINQQRADAIE